MVARREAFPDVCGQGDVFWLFRCEGPLPKLVKGFYNPLYYEGIKRIQ